MHLLAVNSGHVYSKLCIWRLSGQKQGKLVIKGNTLFILNLETVNYLC